MERLHKHKDLGSIIRRIAELLFKSDESRLNIDEIIELTELEYEKAIRTESYNGREEYI